MKLAIFLTATSVFGLQSASASAQAIHSTAEAGQPPQADGATADIIVTATKRSESLSKVPISVTAATGDQLATAGVTDTASLTRIVPGLTAQKTFAGTPSYSLRGVGFSDATLGSLPSVSVYVDQFSLPFAMMSQGATLDLERVEVLKGPQGTLFGQNATGGAINFVANKPTRAFEAGVRLNYGRFNTAEGEGYISGPLGSTLSARLAVSGTRSDDWQYSYTRNASSGAQKKAAARLQLLWEPSAGAKILLSASGWIDKSNPQSPQLYAVRAAFPGFLSPALANYPTAPHNPRAADFDPNGFYTDNRLGQVSLRGDFDIAPGLTLTSLTNYISMRVDQSVDYDGTAVNMLSYTIGGRLSSFGQELRLGGEIGENLKFIAGVNYQKDRSNERDLASYDELSQVRVLGIPQPFTSNFTSGIQSHENKSAFGNIDYKFTSKLTLSLGLRYTDIDHRLRNACSADTGDGRFAAFIKNAVSDPVRGSLGLPPVPFPPGVCITLDPATFAPALTNTAFSEDNWSWRANLAYQATSTSLFYATVSRGFKGGSYINNSTTLSTQYTNPIRQEQLTAYEIGAKIGLFDRKVQLNGAAFYYDYKDKQLFGTLIDPIFGRLFQLFNIPKSRVQGFDLEAVVLPVEGLTLRGAVNYTDSKVTSSFLTPNVGTPVNKVLTPGDPDDDIKGRPFNYAPKWNATADAEYQWELTGNKRAFLGGSMLYNSATNGALNPGADPVISNLTAIKGYATLDVRAGLRGAGNAWEFMLYGRNVTNTYYWNNAIVYGDVATRYAGMPATYGAQFRYSF